MNQHTTTYSKKSMEKGRGFAKSSKKFIRRWSQIIVFGSKYVSFRDLYQTTIVKKSEASKSKKIFWLGAFPPWQRNVGDQAQTYATILFLNKYFPDYRVERFDKHEMTVENLEMIRETAEEADFILVSSNGDFGDVYADKADAMSHVRRMVAEILPDARKIYLSSTVCYKDLSPQNHWIQKDLSLFSSPDNFILCRECASLQILNQVGLNGAVFPDIVFFLKPKNFKKPKQNNKRALVILRDIHRESSLSAADHTMILDLTKKAGFSVYSEDIHFAKSPLHDFMYEKYFNHLNATYQEYGLVITDRMHSMIFAALNGVPCIAIKNGIPHKIPAYQERLWQGTVFIDSAEALPSAIRKASELNPEPTDFTPEFDSFRERFVDTQS